MESEIEKLRSELQQANARERDLKEELAKRDAELTENARRFSSIWRWCERRRVDERDDQSIESMLDDLYQRLTDRYESAEAELARCKDLVSERTEQANGFEQALIAAQAENARLAAETSAFCEWSYNEDYSYFDGMCGAAWYFEHVSEDEVPSKTLRFCPSCGKQIKRVERTRAAGPAAAGGGREA